MIIRGNGSLIRTQYTTDYFLRCEEEAKSPLPKTQREVHERLERERDCGGYLPIRENGKLNYTENGRRPSSPFVKDKLNRHRPKARKSLNERLKSERERREERAALHLTYWRERERGRKRRRRV